MLHKLADWTSVYPNLTTPAGGIEIVEHCGDGGCLYNIKKDPEEQVNLATKMPNILKEMQQKLAKYQATYFNPNHGMTPPTACQTVMNKYKGFWGPFIDIN